MDNNAMWGRQLCKNYENNKMFWKEVRKGETGESGGGERRKWTDVVGE